MWRSFCELNDILFGKKMRERERENIFSVVLVSKIFKLLKDAFMLD